MVGESYNLQYVNFLLVEDNAHMRKLVRSILAALGARSVLEAADVDSAYRELAIHPIDIVICDWQMEPVDGLDFVRKLRNDKDSPNPLIPIIMLSAHSEMSRVTEARDCGINEFVVKPVSAKSLYARIKEIIKNPRAFVQTATYFGPDRRRHQAKYEGAERRIAAPEASPGNAGAKALPNG